MTTQPSGCRHCGHELRDHLRRWAPEIGWRAWTEPTQEQRKERMIARRAERIAARQPTVLLALTADTSSYKAALQKSELAALQLQVAQLRTALKRRTREWSAEQRARIKAEQATIAADQRVRKAEAAIARVRRLSEMTIASSCRVQAIDQARDTLAALDQPDAARTPPPA